MKKILICFLIIFLLSGCSKAGEEIILETGQSNYEIVESDSIIVTVITNDEEGFTVNVLDDSVVSVVIDSDENAMLISGREVGETTLIIVSNTDSTLEIELAIKVIEYSNE